MKITKSQLKRLIEAELVRSHKPELTTPAEEPVYSTSFSPAQQKVVDLTGDLADAIGAMEHWNSDLVDYYVVLFRTLEESGVNLSYLAGISSRK